MRGEAPAASERQSAQMDNGRCKTVCHRFGMRSLGERFRGVDDPVRCCGVCDEVYPEGGAAARAAALGQLDPSSCVEAVVVELRRCGGAAVALASASVARVRKGDPRGIDVLTVAHGTDNADYVRHLVLNSTVLHADEQSGRLRFLDLQMGDLPTSRVGSFGLRETDLLSHPDRYSLLLKSRRFWNSFKCDRILLMQSDSVLCRNSDVSLSEFFEYEYIGGHTPSINHGSRIHMNGGLSFRHRAGMLRCLESQTPQNAKEEDAFFSECKELQQPPVDVVDRFAIDNAYKPVSAKSVPLGVHKPWVSDHGQNASNMAVCEGAWDLRERMLASIP